MKNYTIKNSNVTFGNQSPIIISANNTDWDSLQNECINLMKNLNEDEIRRYQIKSLAQCIFTKDWRGIKKYISKFGKFICTQTVSTVLAEFAADILKSYMK